MALVFKITAGPPSDDQVQEAAVIYAHLQTVQQDFGEAKTTCSAVTVDYARKCVNPYELLSHVDFHDVAGHKNRAFYKLLEVVALFPQIQGYIANGRTLHLCEAPGNFIDAATFLSRGTNDWHASSLRGPHHITFYAQHLEAKKTNGHARVIFGEDGTGDITHFENAKQLIYENGLHRATLVTADGGFQLERDEYQDQEERSHVLWAAELYTGLRALDAGGALILKMFQAYHPVTHSLLALLIPLFGTVHLVKLRTSRICNGECYVVAEQFHKAHAQVGPTLDILKEIAFQGLTTQLPITLLKTVYQAFMTMAQQQITACTDCVALAHYLQALGVVTMNDVRLHCSQLYDNEMRVAAAHQLLDEIYPKS